MPRGVYNHIRPTDIVDLYKQYNEWLLTHPRNCGMVGFRNHLVQTRWNGRSEKELPSARSLRRHLKRNNVKSGGQGDIKDCVMKQNRQGERRVAACGHSCHPKLWAHLTLHYPNGGDLNKCHTCMSYEMARCIESQKEEALTALLDCGLRTKDLYWPDRGGKITFDDGMSCSSHVTVLGNGITAYVSLPSKLKNDPTLARFLYLSQAIRILSVANEPSQRAEQSVTNTNEKQILGARLPRHYQYREEQTLWCPDDSMGFLYFGGCDFAMIGKLDMSYEAEVEIARQAVPHMQVATKSTRAGHAAGRFMPLPVEAGTEFDTNHHSAVTKVDRSYVFGRKGGMKMVYLNSKTGCVIDTSWGTGRNPTMLRRNCIGKRQGLVECWALREKTIVEMESRIVTMVFLSQMNLFDHKVLWKSLQVAIEATCHGNMHGYQFWKSVEPNMTTWHASLLEWASSTGEMHNYEALRAHKDGNKSNPIESYTLHGKTDPSNPLPCSLQVQKMVNGTILFPTHHCGIGVLCGRNVLHMSLKDTIHVPDGTRGKDNWSMVHGP